MRGRPLHIDAPIRRARRLSLTSLIDVIFLLLLFFMLSSTFARFAEIDVKAGGGSGAAASKPDVILSLTPQLWSLNGETVTPDAIGARLSALREIGAADAMVLVSGALDSQDLVTALEALRNSGFNVSVAR